MTKFSGLLDKKDKSSFIELITKYKDFFAWDYHEMSGLSRDLEEHRLPIKQGFKPHQQPPRRCNLQLMPLIKGEIDMMLGIGFIRMDGYVNWLSNIVSVIKRRMG